RGAGPAPGPRLGTPKAARAHLKPGAEWVRQLTLDDPGNAEYRRQRANGLGGRAEVLGWAGRQAEAIEAARQAVAARKELAADPGIPNDRAQLVVAYHNLGYLLSRSGQSAEAERWYNAALAAGDQVARDHPATAARPLYRSNRGATHHFLGVLRGQAGDTVGAVKLLREAAVIRARLADDFPRS